jgi:general secretion pathway protein K
MRTRNRGVALITAMLITALAGLVAANLAWDNALDVRRTMVLLYHEQAVQVALGAENYAAKLLAQDLQDSETDHLGEIWATDLPGFPIDGGEVFGVIEDLQGRFNVNNLINEEGQVEEESLERFRRLLTALDLDPRLAGVASDWIDSNIDASFPDGAEDSIYTGVLPPYRSANRSLTSASEFAALDGMDRKSFLILRPHVTALPGRTNINANTATAAVLQSLDENMAAADVERLMTERETAGFADIQTAFSSLVTADVLNTLDESTSYFRLKVVVRIDTVRITMYSVLQRGPQGSVIPILRSFGTP